MLPILHINIKFPLVILLLFASIAQVGCQSASTKKDESSTAVQSSETSYRPQQDISVFGPDTENLASSYTGFYHCPNVSMQFTFNIQAVDKDTISGELVRTVMDGSPSLRYVKAKTTRVPFRGYYNPVSSRLSFKVLPTRNGESPMIYKMAELSGVMLPDASGFVLFDSFPTSKRCTAWIAKSGKEPVKQWQFIVDESRPGEKAGILDRLWGGFDPEKARKEDQARGQCPDNIYRWLLQADKAPKILPSNSLDYVRIMYSDRHFVPYFGKPFSALDKEERAKLSVPMRGSCLQDARLTKIGTGLVSQVTVSFNDKSYMPGVDKVISTTAYNMAYSWMNQAKQHLSNMANKKGNPDNVKILLRDTNKLLNRIYPDEKKEFVSHAEQQYRAMIIPALARSMKKELVTAKPTMVSLNELAGFDDRSIKRYPEVDRKALSNLTLEIEARVNADAPAAAQAYANSVQGIDGFLTLQQWATNFHYLRSHLNNPTLKKLKETFSQRQQYLAAQILKDEKAAFRKKVVNLKASPEAIRTGADYEKQFHQKYNMLSSMPGYQAFEESRKKQRSSMFKLSEDEFMAFIKKQPHESSLKRLASNYFIDGDRQLPGTKKVFAEYNRSSKKIAPFQGNGPFDQYMNALYTYDESYLRDVDKRSIAPILRSMQGLMPILDIAGGLISILSGGSISGDKVVKSEIAEAREMSLIQPMMAFYVLNYEKYNGQCVEANAVPYEITTRWTEYTESDGYRYKTGHTEYKTQYKVNRRFVAVFKNEYKNDGDSMVAKFSDRFFQGSGKIYRDELINGMVQFMRRDCNTSIVIRMEKNMLRYYNSVQARIQKAKQKAWQ